MRRIENPGARGIGYVETDGDGDLTLRLLDGVVCQRRIVIHSYFIRLPRSWLRGFSF